ncbi:MAG TPA: helix-turn-helix domain-containing protein, partial [Magnetospirillaceae bacterium]
MADVRMGGKLRRLRQERQLTQAQMAEQLAISASYLNLIENNQRPLTVPVLLKLAQRFSIDIEMFNAGDEGALLDDLMEAFADPLFDAQGIKAGDLKELVAIAPAVGRGILTLYRATRGSRTPTRPADAADVTADGEIELPSGMPSEEVSDFIAQNNNYFASLEQAAQNLWTTQGLSIESLYQDLSRALTMQYAVDVAVMPAAAMGNVLREYKPLQRRLCLSELLPVSSRIFQLAHQVALLGHRD